MLSRWPGALEEEDEEEPLGNAMVILRLLAPAAGRWPAEEEAVADIADDVGPEAVDRGCSVFVAGLHEMTGLCSFAHCLLDEPAIKFTFVCRLPRKVERTRSKDTRLPSGWQVGGLPSHVVQLINEIDAYIRSTVKQQRCNTSSAGSII